MGLSLSTLHQLQWLCEAGQGDHEIAGHTWDEYIVSNVGVKLWPRIGMEHIGSELIACEDRYLLIR